MTIEANAVVVLDYELKVNGEVIDSSFGQEPLSFIHGVGALIPGFSAAIDGLKKGDKKAFVVSAEDGYGELDEEAIRTYAKDDFPGDVDLSVGAQLFFETEDQMEIPCFVKEVVGNDVIIDFNHPLAGKELHFNIEVKDVRLATEEEKAHGHVHGAHGHHH